MRRSNERKRPRGVRPKIPSYDINISKIDGRYARVRGGTRRYPAVPARFGYVHPEAPLPGTRWNARVRDGLLLRWYAMIYIATRIR